MNEQFEFLEWEKMGLGGGVGVWGGLCFYLTAYVLTEGACELFCLPSFGQCHWPWRVLVFGDMLVKNLHACKNWHPA